MFYQENKEVVDKAAKVAYNNRETVGKVGKRDAVRSAMFPNMLDLPRLPPHPLPSLAISGCQGRRKVRKMNLQNTLSTIFGHFDDLAHALLFLLKSKSHARGK